MMILGVALWLFPRPVTSDIRYQPRMAGVAYWLLALGTAARLAGELSRISSDATLLRWLVILSSFAQIAGIGLFFHTMWSRIRPAGSQKRKEYGERF